MNQAQVQAIIAFWFALGWDDWWHGGPELDAEIRKRFEPLWAEQREHVPEHFLGSADEALAAVLLFDQFPRNMFRGDPCTYATDPLAREVAAQAIAEGADKRVDPTLQQFLYMPFMHSEALADQEKCVALFSASGEPENAKYAQDHADIIRRFGRFPHRNKILSRATTEAEQKFLEEGGFAG